MSRRIVEANKGRTTLWTSTIEKHTWFSGASPSAAARSSGKRTGTERDRSQLEEILKRYIVTSTEE